MGTHLRLDQNQVDEYHDEIVFDILVTELSAFPTYAEPDIMACGRITTCGVLCP